MLYQIGVYNKRVRDTLRSGVEWKSSTGISEVFEDINYFDFQAASMEEAEKRVERDYPKRLGFVLEFIRTVK